MGELFDGFAIFWALLVDKGYQGLLEYLQAIHPKKKPPRTNLSFDDNRRNEKVFKDRVVVENFFGRMATLRILISSKWR